MGQGSKDSRECAEIGGLWSHLVSTNRIRVYGSWLPSEVAVKSLAMLEVVEKGEKGTGVDAVLLVSDGARNRDILRKRT